MHKSMPGSCMLPGPKTWVAYSLLCESEPNAVQTRFSWASENVPKLVFMSNECSGYIVRGLIRLPCLIMSLHSCLRLQDYVIFLRKNLKYTFSNLHLVAGHTDHHRFWRQELGVQLTQYRVGLQWEVKLYWFDWLIVLLNSSSSQVCASLSLSLKMGTKSGAAISSMNSR